MKKTKDKRVFGSGAYRDQDETKLQFRRCLSHRVLFSFAEFMRAHNTMKDGTRRNEENWKKGFPQESFMDSKFRHFMTTWKTYEEMLDIKDLIESLNAELFNVMGWLDLLLRPGMTIDKFRKTIEGIEKLGKKVVDTRSKSRKEKDKAYFEKTLKRIEERKQKRKKKPIHYAPFTKTQILRKAICNGKLSLRKINITTDRKKATCLTCKKIIKGWKI